MATIVKPIYTQQNIWGSEGAKTLPPEAKIKVGWGQEMMPAEYENWVQNRQDHALAYLYQFGLAEWDSLTEYAAGKSLVQYDGQIYRALTDNKGVTPNTTTAWRNIFTGTNFIERLGGATGAAIIPVGTTAQRPAGATPGHFRYNSTTTRMEFFGSTNAWIEVIDRGHGITGTGFVVFADSPEFTGTPKVPTAPLGDNSTRAASTGFVKAAIDASRTSGADTLKFASRVVNESVTTIKDVPLATVVGATGYLLMSVVSEGAPGDVWDIEIYDNTVQNGNLLYFSKLLTGKFRDSIPILLTTAKPVVRIVNQRVDAAPSVVKIDMRLIPCS